MSRGMHNAVQFALNGFAAVTILLCGVGLFTHRVENFPSYLSVAMLGVVVAQNLELRQQLVALQAKVSAISEK